MGKMVLPHFLCCFDQILFILAGNNDIQQSLKDFEIRPDLTTDYRVNCPLPVVIYPIDFKFVRIKDMHYI